MKSLLYILSCLLLLVFISSCRQKFADAEVYRSVGVNHLDETNYVYDIKIKDGYTYILDDKNDSILRIYRNKDLRHPERYISKGATNNELQKPSFSKEIPAKPYDGIRVMDNNLYLKVVDMKTDSLISSIEIISRLWNCIDYNFTSDGIYTSPYSHHKQHHSSFMTGKMIITGSSLMRD